MKVMVTGGSGRMGQEIVPALAEQGHEVVHADRRPPKEGAPGRFISLELGDRSVLRAAMRGVDVVVHLAEQPAGGAGGLSGIEAFRANGRVGENVFVLAAELRCRRVVYASSIHVYGFTDGMGLPPERLPVDEDHPLLAGSAGGLSKVEVEAMGRLCAERAGVAVTAFRLPWVVSGEQGREWFEGVEARSGKMDSSMGVYVHGSDATAAFVKAVESELPGFEAYNLSAADVMSARPITEAIARDLPGYPSLPADWGEWDSPYAWGKARVQLGWVPRWSFRQAFRAALGREMRVVG